MANPTHGTSAWRRGGWRISWAMAAAFALTAGGLKASTLINLSTMAPTSPGSNLTVGFSIGGSGTKQALVRGIGPALTTFGIPGAVPDPLLQLFGPGSALLNSNSGWGSSAALQQAFAQTYAFALPLNSPDAAILMPLEPKVYSATVTGAAGDSGTAMAEIYDADSGATPTARLVNLSSSSLVGAGTAGAMTAGFVVSGTGQEEVLIRGIGPALGVFGLPNYLPAPTLTVFDGNSNVIATNSGWANAAALSAAFAQTGAFSLAASSKDCAVLLNLAPGKYSAMVASGGSATGVALAEVYEVSPPLPIATQIANFLAQHPSSSTPLTCALAPGTYSAAATPINLNNVSYPNGLTIDGTDVHIVMTQYVSGVLLQNDTGITVSNLTIDYDPLPFTQGTVTQVYTNSSGAETGCLLTLDSGAEWAPPAAASATNVTGRVWALDPATGNLAYGTGTYYLSGVTAQGNGQYLLTFSSAMFNDALKPGYRLSLPLTGAAHAVNFRADANCGVNNVQVYASPSIGVFDQYSSGSFFTHVAVIPNPATTRVRSANADGIHVQGCVNGPTITNCTVLNPGDDEIVTHAELGLVMQAAASTNSIQFATEFQSGVAVAPFKVGDTIGIYPGNGTGTYTTATIATITAQPSIAPPAQLGYVYTITLAPGQLVTVDTATWIDDETRAASNFIVKDNTVANSRARGIFCRGINGSILDNKVSYCAMAGIGSIPFANNPFEGDFARNLLIEGNTVTGANSAPNTNDNLAGAISVSVDVVAPGGTGTGATSWGSRSGNNHVMIIGNTVTGSRGPALLLYGGTQWEVSGNTFAAFGTLTPPTGGNRILGLDEKAAVWLASVDGVTFGDQGANTVVSPGANYDAFVAQGANVTNVTGLNTFGQH